ncbi:hypothetical protein JHW43_006995 [Diplocarpon mali]|nr:hypothetical protein JHW43_006995 [Diplocarpon mali]
MSTFKGVMQGFEDIRVDYFRPALGLSTPRACFVSHVHSDHLAGLDSKKWKSSFIYCSPATREILIRLEKRVDRYGHLEKLLKPIPLETPTQIELKPGVKLQVTLFDANHCAGAVMFLFELDNLAVLYTGDVRSEPWHVTSLARNPILIEYTSGLKTLDCIYLDTSRTDPSVFPPKADGLKELLQKVVQYPPDAVFHFAAWTYGSWIHVNKYTYRIFESLSGGTEDKKRPPTGFMIHEGPALAGYNCNELSGRPQIEFDHDITIDQLMALFPHTSEVIKRELRQLLVTALESPGRVLYLGDLGLDDEQDNISLPQLAEAILQSVTDKQQVENRNSEALSRTVTFPYSRHSSYEELCINLSIRDLFGDHCSAAIFRYDTEMMKVVAESKARYHSQQSQTTASSQHSIDPKLSSPPRHEEIDVAAIEAAAICRATSEEGQKSPSFLASANDIIGSSNILGVMSTSPPACKTVPRIFIKRNEQGRLRPFDEHCNEIALPYTPMTKNELAGASGRRRGSSQSFVIADPECFRPGFEVSIYQNSRSGTPSNVHRREASGEIHSGNAKRPRLTPNGPDSLVTDRDLFNPISMPPADSFIDPAAVVGQSEIPENSHGQPSSDPSRDDGAHTAGSREESDGSDDEPNKEPTTYYDPVDEVIRCKTCGYEVYGGVAAYYCIMGCGKDDTPYFEDKREEAMPQIALDKYSDEFVVDSNVVKEIVGDYLDYESSAYDTQDSVDAHFLEDYEDNSMIDDEEILGPDSEDEPTNSNETDWQARFAALQAEHSRLGTNFDVLFQQHCELRRELLDTDSEGDKDDDADDYDGIDEDGLLVVDASAPDPVVTEIVLSQARAQSQESEISNGRILNRAVAYEAAEAGGWHEISLASVEGNHTHPEVEL